MRNYKMLQQYIKQLLVHMIHNQININFYHLLQQIYHYQHMTVRNNQISMKYLDLVNIKISLNN